MKKLIALSAMLVSFTIQADPTVMIHKNNAERYVRVDLEENRSFLECFTKSICTLFAARVPEDPEDIGRKS